MWLRLIEAFTLNKAITIRSAMNYGHRLVKLPESKCKPSLNDEQVNRDCVIHAHCTWLKVHIDSCHGYEKHYNDASCLFINELINERMNWPTSLVQTRPMIRMIRPRSQFELVSFIEWSQRNVSFWWMSIVSGHFDDHSLFLSLMTDSLSGIAFTIVMLTWLEIVESTNDDCSLLLCPRFRGLGSLLNG